MKFFVLALICLMVIVSSNSYSRDYVIAVDTSGSMLWSVKGKDFKPSKDNPKRIEVVKPSLKMGLEALPQNTRVTLIEFNTGVRSVKDFVLDRPESRAAAIQWVEALNPSTSGDTHLWASMRQGFQVMRGYLQQSVNKKQPGQVLVRFYTDGDNDDKSPETRSLTLQQVLAEFPEVDGKSIRPDIVLLGPDLSMSAEVSKILKEPRVNAIKDPKMMVPFPPVIVWRPDPIIEGQMTSFLENSKSTYKAFEWKLDGKLVSKDKFVDVPVLKAGMHKISLEVRHADGLPDFSEETVEVLVPKAPPPEAHFDVLPDVAFHPGDKLTFRAKQTKPDWKHEWLLDNGVKLEGAESSWTAEKAVRVKVTHRITSSTGVVESQQTLIGSEVELPDASFNATPRIFTVGENVTLQAKTDKSGWQHAWMVQTAQGKLELKGAQAVWKSDAEGKVTLRHTVTAGSTTNFMEDEIAGRLSLKIVAKIKASPRSGTYPLTVQFTDASTPPEQIAEYTWDFGDGTSVSHEKSPVHIYDKVGRYPVKLLVTSVQRETAENAERMEIEAKPTWGEWLNGLPVWIKLIAGLLALALLSKWLQKLLGAPLVGQVEWSFGSAVGTVNLRGKRSCNLSTELTPALKAGWKPRKKWIIRNHGGKMKLNGGIKPQMLEVGKPVSADGMTIKFKK